MKKTKAKPWNEKTFDPTSTYEFTLNGMLFVRSTTLNVDEVNYFTILAETSWRKGHLVTLWFRKSANSQRRWTAYLWDAKPGRGKTPDLAIADAMVLAYRKLRKEELELKRVRDDLVHAGLALRENAL